jgi:hypothetical protein
MFTNDELEIVWTEVVVERWRQYPAIILDGLKTTTKNFKLEKSVSGTKFQLNFFGMLVKGFLPLHQRAQHSHFTDI